MARFARIADDVVAEIIVLPDGIEPSAAFHPDVAAELHPCSAEVAEGWTFDGSAFAGPAVPPPTKADLKAYAASRRWAVETGGISVAGAAIQTDRASQAMITGAFAYAQVNPSASIAYKAADGFVTLSAAEVAAIANAVGAHVQDCFAVEASVVDAIDAGSITTIAEIDGVSWPA